MLHQLSHPVILHKITRLRDKNTSVKEFRELVKELTLLLTCEATRHLDLNSITVETPLEQTQGFALKAPIVAIPILRAGLGMVEGVSELFPNVRFGHIGVRRNEETLDIIEYYCNMPMGLENSTVLLLDPMLATGGSASAAISLLKRAGAQHIIFLNIIAAPQGITRMEQEHPDIDIFTCILDRDLNEHGYILPGLGDAGDRVFGTL